MPEVFLRLRTTYIPYKNMTLPFSFYYTSSTIGQVLCVLGYFVVVSTSSVVWSQVRQFFLMRNVFCTINHDE